MKLANLDINNTSLVFEYPNLYYLDLNLKYICNSSKGHAKFDKSKKSGKHIENDDDDDHKPGGGRRKGRGRGGDDD
jgi:hypothetical protein